MTPERLRVLVTTLPFVSHFLAQRPLAEALAAAGHEIRFATSGAKITASARRAGFEVVPVPMTARDHAAEELRLPGGPGSRGRFAYLPHAARVAPALLKVFDSWCPDVVIRDPLEIGSCLAAERVGIPHAVGREGPFWPPAMRHSLGFEIDDLRSQLGLPPDPEADMLYRYLGFVFAPPDLLGPEVVAHPMLHFIRPDPSDQAEVIQTQSWDPPPPGRPLVYATLGTVFNARGEPLLRAMAVAMAGEAYDALVTTGPGLSPDRFAWAGDPANPRVANVMVRQYVPQSTVLPRAAAIVAHGGFGTVVGALLHGVPLVLLPLAGDQHRNAQWCEAQGAALVLDEDRRSPRTIRLAVREVLSDPSYRRAAASLARATADLPDMGHAVSLVERLARDRLPIPRPLPARRGGS